MRSSDALYRPAEWPDHVVPIGKIGGLVAIICLAGVALLVALAAWADEMPKAALYCLVFALVMLSGAAVSYLMTMRAPKGTADIRVIDGTLEIRYSSALFASVVAMNAFLAILFVGGALELAFDGGVGGAIVLAPFGAYCALFFVFLFIGRIRQGYVRLSRDGIRHRGWTFESYLPWDAVAGGKAFFHVHRMVNVIAYANAPWERRNTTWLWRIDTLPPVPLIEFDCRKYDIDSLVLFHLVTLYANNPAARDELGTGISLERVRNLQF